MSQEIVLDRALYKKIKAMDKQQMQNFLVSLYNNAQTDMNAASVDLTELRNEIGAIRGIGEGCCRTQGEQQCERSGGHYKRKNYRQQDC